MSKSAGKDNAAKFVAEKTGVTLENVISVGDSGNDVALAKIYGLSLAVSNACNKMKEAADVIICNNNENVASYILNEYFN